MKIKLSLFITLSFLLLVGVGLLNGCAQKARITKRYERAYGPFEQDDKAERGPVRLSAFVKGANAPTKKTIFDLSERAQAEYVAQLGEKSAEASELATNMASEFKKNSVGPHTTFTKQIVISLNADGAFSVGGQKYYLKSSDRLEAISIEISILGDAVVFSSWDKFETEFDSVDLGNLSSNQSENFSVELKGSAPVSIPVEGGANYNRSNSLNEDISLRQRFVVMTGALLGNRALLDQQGATGIDLKGNSSITVNLTEKGASSVVRVQLDSTLFDENGKAVEPHLVKLKPVRIPLLGIEGPVSATVTARYKLRHILSGHESNHEGDDTVQFVEGDVDVLTSKIVIIEKSEIDDRKFDLELENYALVAGKYSVAAEDRELLFYSKKQAEDFQKWLKEIEATKGRSVREIGGKELYLMDRLGGARLPLKESTSDDESGPRLQDLSPSNLR